ncbi:hypothetical protein STCU_04938 [Strigomonas culicis]|uniref:Uncharacterized protein n=1 Tax=Strigomonas culicis TaxID=28005 RepID=S9UIB4_9TRYP|nr:hypothetical protein STCU_04938 [Strigomonas culicis]|eukprot:EPY28673.1 hypothetical protein STCU_04938 [Strigomonas culicis]
MGPFAPRRADWGGGRLGNEATCSGVFVHAAASAPHYTIGLITRGTRRNAALHQLLQDFCLLLEVRAPAATFVPLPIGAELRRVRMRLWWLPSEQRVRPHETLPPIKVILRDGGAAGTTAPTAVTGPSIGPAGARPAFLAGYSSVRLRLNRPSGASLCGTCQQEVPLQGQLTMTDQHHPTESPPDITQPTATHDDEALSVGSADTMVLLAHACPAADDPLSTGDLAERHPVLDTHTDGMPLVSAAPPRHSCRRAELVFSDITVLHEGEHMISVDVTVRPSYEAFVSPLIGYLSPFLVVSKRGDAS